MNEKMPLEGLNDLIVKLLTNVDMLRLSRKEISRSLSDEELSILINGEFIKEEKALPYTCQAGTCPNPANCIIEEGKLIITDIYCPTHRVVADINEYIIYEIDLFRCFSTLINDLVENSETVLDEQTKESCRIEISTELGKFFCFSSISGNIRDSDLLKFLSGPLSSIYPKIIILRESSINKESLGSILSKESSQEMIHYFYLDKILSKNTKKNLNSWIKRTGEKMNEDKSVNVTVTGNQNVVATGSNIEQKVTQQILKGDLDTLLDCMKRIGIAENDIMKLEKAIREDEPVRESDKLGPKVAKWAGKITTKILEGSYKVATSSAASVITAALLKYYGLK